MTETVLTANELWAAKLGFNHAGVQWLTRVLNTALQRGNGQYVLTPADLNSIG